MKLITLTEWPDATLYEYGDCRVLFKPNPLYMCILGYNKTSTRAPYEYELAALIDLLFRKDGKIIPYQQENPFSEAIHIKELTVISN